MPQLQVVNTGANPINTALGNISAGFIDQFNQRQQQAKNDEIFSRIKSKYGPNADPDVMFKDILQAEGFDDSYKQNKLAEISQLGAMERNKKRSLYEDELLNIKKEELGIKQKNEGQEARIAQKAFNRMGELLKKGNIGFGSGFYALAGGQTAEDVGEFSSLTGALEAILKDKVSKGVLSKDRFNYIIQTLLPKPDDRLATIKGKLKGLALDLELDPSILGDEETAPVKQELKGTEPKKRPSLTSFNR